MEKEVIRIGVVSDVVCPWCYIGKNRLKKAMNESADRFAFEVEYFPFELDPTVPQEGRDFGEYLSRKFGSRERYAELSRHVKQVAGQEGLPFNLDIQPVYPNTRNLHRVIMLAREDGKQEAAVDAFFRAFFSEGVDLSRIENIVDIAVKVGLDEEKTDAILRSSTGNLEIEMAEKELQDLGITSVPLFIIDNRFGLAGAQPVEAFTKIFGEAALVSDRE